MQYALMQSKDQFLIDKLRKIKKLLLKNLHWLIQQYHRPFHLTSQKEVIVLYFILIGLNPPKNIIHNQVFHY